MDIVDFMMDSQTAADAFNSVQTNVTEIGQIITSCQSMLCSHFVNYRLKFNRRQANMVSHAFASETTLLTSPNIYLEVPYMYCYSYI